MNQVVLEGLRACFVSVALCAGVKHPGPMPPVRLVLNERNHQTPPKTGFACGWDFSKPEPFPVTDWCGGLTERENGRLVVYVAATRTQALPHEFLHVLASRFHLYDNGYLDGYPDDRWMDPGHTGPYWECAKLCPGLWP